MTGRWMMAAIQTTFAAMPALVYWFAGWTMANGSGAISIGTLVAFTTLRRGSSSRSARCSASRSTVSRSRSSTGSSSTSTSRSTSSRARGRSAPAGDVAFEDRALLRYGNAPGWRSGRHVADPAGTSRRSWSDPAPARRPVRYLVRGCTTPTRGKVTINGIDVREGFDALRPRIGVITQRRTSSTPRSARTSAPPTGGDRRPDRWAARAAKMHDRFIASLSEGYDTVVGARLRPASGGERQRMRRAQRSCGRPADPHPRRGDLRARRKPSADLRGPAGGWHDRTRSDLASALHRRYADQIVVLDQGRVVELGRTRSCSVSRALRLARLP